MNHRRLTRSAALGLALTALAAPAVAAQQDLRSPDTRDSAGGRGSFDSPEVTVVKVPEPPPATSAGGGLDWGDAGIGAGGLLGLILLALGGTLAVLHRRQRAGRRPATTG